MDENDSASIQQLFNGPKEKDATSIEKVEETPTLYFYDLEKERVLWHKKGALVMVSFD